MPLVLAALAFGPEVAASMRAPRSSSKGVGVGVTASSTNNQGPVNQDGHGQGDGDERLVEEYIIAVSDGELGEERSAGESPSPSPPGGTTPRSYMRSASWRDWLSFSWRSNAKGQKVDQEQLQQEESLSGMDSPVSQTPRGGEDAGGVPPEAEAALLAAALGQASQVQVEEIKGIRRSATGKPSLLVKRRRAFVPTPDQLATELAPILKPGQNTVEFTYGKQQLRAYIYLVSWNTRIIISDVDGTITKSDVLGHLGQLSGLFDWTHSGVAPLLNRIQANGYCTMFLSSRSIAQASITRDYLHSLTQDGYTMPAGPVMLAPDGLFPALFREVVLRRPQEFKIRCLEDIKSLFPEQYNPFFAGFGNRDTDEMSYMAVGVPTSRIFIINPKGELRKACSAVRTSTWSTLSGLSRLVDSMFPAIAQHRWGQAGAPLTPALQPTKGGSVDDASVKEQKKGGMVDEDPPCREDFNDLHYWRVQPSIVIEDDEAFGDPEGGGHDASYDDDGGGVDLDEA